jgi:hypothetical protein
MRDDLCVADADRTPIQDEFAAVQQRWRHVIAAHRQAPPDPGFSARLAALSEVSRAEAEVCRKAHAEGYEWPPHKSAGSQPWELQPGSGRRGPEELWRTFDIAVLELERAGAGTDLLAVAAAHDLLADAAGALAEAVECEDRESGVLPPLSERRSA